MELEQWMNRCWVGWPLGDHIKVYDVMTLAAANCHHRCKDKDLQIELPDDWVHLSSHTGASWQSSINESFLRLVHTSQWSFLQCIHFGSFQLPSSVNDEGSKTHTLCRSCCHLCNRIYVPLHLIERLLLTPTFTSHLHYSLSSPLITSLTTPPSVIHRWWCGTLSLAASCRG